MRMSLFLLSFGTHSFFQQNSQKQTTNDKIARDTLNLDGGGAGSHQWMISHTWYIYTLNNNEVQPRIQNPEF